MGIRISKDHLHPSVIESITSLIGDLNQLETTAKGNAVEAINELLARMGENGENEVLEAEIERLQSEVERLESETKFKKNIKIFYQTEEPTATQYGDLWVPIDSTELKEHFVKSASEILNPTGNDLYFNVSNKYIEFNLDESVNDFLDMENMQFLINSVTGSPHNNTENCNIPLLVSILHKIYVRIENTMIYNETTNLWDRVHTKFWNGEAWVGFTSGEVIVYGFESYNASVYIFAYDIISKTRLWETKLSSAYSGQTRQADCKVVLGNNTVGGIVYSGDTDEDSAIFIVDRNTGEIILNNAIHTMSSPRMFMDYCKDGSYIYVNRSGNYADTPSISKFSEADGSTIATLTFSTTNNAYKQLYAINDKLVLLPESGNNSVAVVSANLDNYFESTAEVHYSSTAGHPTVTSDGKIYWLTVDKYVGTIAEIDISNAVDSDSIIVTPSKYSISLTGTITYSLHSIMNPETGEEQFIVAGRDTADSSSTNYYTMNFYLYDRDFNLIKKCSARNGNYPLVDSAFCISEGGYIYMGRSDTYGVASRIFRYNIFDETHEQLFSSRNTSHGIDALITSSGTIHNNPGNYGL